MPNDNINRAIKKGAGRTGGRNLRGAEVRGLRRAGVAVIVEAAYG